MNKTGSCQHTRRALTKGTCIVLALACVAARAAPADEMLKGHHVIATAPMAAGSPVRRYRIVVLGRNGEGVERPAPRPLLVFEETNGQPRLMARNDHVAMRADEGGQCDPFDPASSESGGIAVKGRYFTIENGVGCGNHWTDNITFRLDDRLGFVFDNRRMQTWRNNADQRDEADALVGGAVRITRGDRKRPVSLQHYR